MWRDHQSLAGSYCAVLCWVVCVLLCCVVLCKPPLYF